MEYPIPLEQQRDQLLYLQLETPVSALSTDAVADQHPATRAVSAKAKAVMQSPDTMPTSAPVAVPYQSATQQASSMPSAQICDWQRVDLTRIEGVTDNQGVEMQIQLVFPANMPPQRIPTGLVLRRETEGISVARGYTDTNGCLRYLLKVERNARYELVAMLDTGLSVFALPSVVDQQGPVRASISIPSQKARSFIFEGLNVIFEPMSNNRVRVIQMALLSAPDANAAQSQQVYLPISSEAQGIQFEKDSQWVKWTKEKEGLKLQTPLKSGQNQLLYAYVLSAQKGQIRFLMQFPHDVSRGAVFFSQGLAPEEGRDQLQPVKLGEGDQQREFKVLHLPAVHRTQILQFHIGMMQAQSKGLMAWIQRHKSDPTKRNKLFGLAALFVVCIIGIFWFVSSSRPISST
jgi:hypothetical protein